MEKLDQKKKWVRLNQPPDPAISAVDAPPLTYPMVAGQSISTAGSATTPAKRDFEEEFSGPT
jgi:hypothetical protein